IGHASSYSHDDFIARYKRMKGFEVFYPFGTDDNGLPTERLIERLKNVKSKSMTRAKFISLCLKTLKEITPAFVQDWKNLAISCDYGVYYSTIDDNSRKISQASFIKLYKKGFVYKENFPTIYCPECQTPVAQAELEDKNKDTLFSTLRFLTEEGNDLPIATTRPELLGACVAVFVNPDDKRYKDQIGRKATVPLFEHEVPIIADKSADVEKGTGVLMVCSYGDKYDVDAVKRYKLEPRIIFSLEGRVKSGKYEGLTISEARKKILEDLKAKDLIMGQKSITHTLNVHDKCGTGIEFLPTEQWFIKILDKKKELIAQGKKIKWHPKFMFKRYENWVNGLEWDWSSSRDRHFGVPIPAWYCESCNEIIVADEKELPVDPAEREKKCPKCKGAAKPEMRVLDTWLTSSLTPQIASSLVGGKVKIPYDLRPQAHDIIRTWAFYTIVKSFYHEKKIPWNEIAISGFVTLGKEKMSKSKGNVIRPSEVMDNFGSDALRYWAASSKLGNDVDYQENDLIAGKKFVTKLLNASRFVFMNLKHQNKKPELLETDRLFLLQLNKLIRNVTGAFEDYDYARAKLETEKFFWGTFADNYLEIVKNRVYNGGEKEKASAFWTLYNSLLAIVKLMAPITPYIAEEVYQNHFKEFEKEKSVHVSAWPEVGDVKSEKGDDKKWDDFLGLIARVRQAKSNEKKAMNFPVRLSLSAGDLKMLEGVLDDFKSVTNALEIGQGKFDVGFERS
ncbi:MAG: valine--tRNA ligase, partial [Nanoarchaeota archaeon]|nr:valine--tRNA ligase [Nanoarchaeota archaeon]